MDSTALDVILDSTDAHARALAPRVGTFSATVRPGDLVQAGGTLGELTVLNRRIALRLPHGAPTLRVVTLPHETRLAPVGYGELLADLEAASLDGAAGASATTSAASAAASLGLPPDAVAARAPVDGQFYAQPSPDDPPFVREGDVVGHGQIVGLVEVMKFFYEVTFEAPDPAARYEVLRVVAHNGTTLVSGEPIAWLAPRP